MENLPKQPSVSAEASASAAGEDIYYRSINGTPFGVKPEYRFYNFGYTINVSPKKHLATAMVNEVLAKCPHTVFRSYPAWKAYVQYEKMDEDRQKWFTTYILNYFVTKCKDCEFGKFVWEQTKAGNYHIHGYYVAPSPNFTTEQIEAINFINHEFGSGVKSACIYVEVTHINKDAWNVKYMEKDQNYKYWSMSEIITELSKDIKLGKL